MKPNLNPHKVDHLFLLVGKNPLPNYVVSKSNLLLREGGKPYLVYTTDTEKYAHKLRDKLGISNQELISLGQSQSDAFIIQTRIRDKAKGLSGRLGLNYTGGTKAMSVNSYIAIKSIEREEESVFSYLDPKTLKLLIDISNNSPLPIEIDLEMTFDELFDLHLIKLRHSPIQQPIFPELTEVLSKHTQEWRTWCNETLYFEAKWEKSNGKIDWKSKEKLGAITLPLKGLPSQIVDLFNEIKFLDSQGNLSVHEMLLSECFSSPINACKWLDGIWLEHYLLSQIQKEFLQARLSFGVSTIDFEFDVAFIKKYQLFAFSCTTSDDKSRCKSKLFEAYIRGKQLGGDEARVALVCCSDCPEILENEISGIIPDSKVKVFGRKHLKDISGKVSEWVKEQSGND